MCFFGDGTTNIGAFHEALNFAVVWKLPVVFVCENNLYMEYTPIARVTAVEHPAADRAAAYGLESIVIDGNDADEVLPHGVQAHSTRARDGGGPALIEAMTYRHSGHSRADPGEVPARRRARRVAASAIRSTIYRDAAARARASPKPTLDDIDAEAHGARSTRRPRPPRRRRRRRSTIIEKNVWADGGSAWRN